jgi:hypothetical protein
MSARTARKSPAGVGANAGPPSHRTHGLAQNADWYGAPRVLESLLALCEPPGWDLTPLQRLGRRNATANALRLWGLLDHVCMQQRAIAPEEVSGIDRPEMVSVKVTGPAAAWHWDAWRHGDRYAGTIAIAVAIEFHDATMDFQIALQDAPALLRRLEVQRCFADDELAHWKWRLSARQIPMSYPQARSLIAALVFRAGSAFVNLEPCP